MSDLVVLVVRVLVSDLAELVSDQVVLVAEIEKEFVVDLVFDLHIQEQPTDDYILYLLGPKLYLVHKKSHTLCNLNHFGHILRI